QLELGTAGDHGVVAPSRVGRPWLSRPVSAAVPVARLVGSGPAPPGAGRHSRPGSRHAPWPSAPPSRSPRIGRLPNRPPRPVAPESPAPEPSPGPVPLPAPGHSALVSGLRGKAVHSCL